jgi:hypothetical protein
MKRILLFFVIIANLSAFNLKDKCPNEIRKYPNAINYFIRFEDYFDDYGCDLVVLYGILDKVENDYILDYIDEHPQIIPIMIKFAKNYPKKFIYLLNNNSFIEFLKENEVQKNFIDNVFYLFKFISYSSLKNEENLKRIYFAAYKENTASNAYYSYQKLKKIPDEFLDTVIAAYLLLKDKFEEIQKDNFISDFLKLKYQLTYRQMKVLCKYNPKYLVTFLYNTKYVNNFDIYQKELVYLYKTLFNKFYDERVILTTTFQFAPYLIDQSVEFTPTFKKVIKDLINTNLITIMLSGDKNKIDVCSDDNFFGILADNNLKKLLIFANYESELYNKYIQSLINYDGNKTLSLFNLFVLANLYYKYGEGSREWEMIKGILTSDLFAGKFINLVNRVNLIARLENIGYFKVLSSQDDYNKFVKNESDDLNSKNTQKYLYILFTSVECQNSQTFINLVENVDKDVIKEYLNKLASYSISELKEHRFTIAEKSEKYVDTVDNILTIGGLVVSIVLAPETGGASLAAYAALQSIKKAGVKTIKKVGFYELKQSSKKYFSKKMFNYYKQQYQKKVKNSYLHSLQKKLDDISETTGNFALGFSGGFFLKDVHFKQICEGE